MPTIRLTYAKDIRREGREVLDVSEGRARVLVNQRRAVVIPAEEALDEMSKDDLITDAEVIGAKVPKRAKKAEIAEAIEDADVT